ncbi:hypothetical protein KKF75_02160 [Patescibacteria group bacterium]|nr:hypothetical protein [Patescibacteria group bacterium]
MPDPAPYGEPVVFHLLNWGGSVEWWVNGEPVNLTNTRDFSFTFYEWGTNATVRARLTWPQGCPPIVMLVDIDPVKTYMPLMFGR